MRQVSVTVLLLLLARSCCVLCQQSAPNGVNRENYHLWAACTEYQKLKDGRTAPASWRADAAAAAGFCEGFFLGYMSTSAEVETGPDQAGRIRVFEISDGTTYDQAIRVYVVALNEKPDLLLQDAGVVISATLQASGLATAKDRPEIYCTAMASTDDPQKEKQAVQDGAPKSCGESGTCQPAVSHSAAPAPSSRTIKAGVEILSDTQGVDFSRYMKKVIEGTKRSWYPIIPEVARPPHDKQGRVGIRFKIYPDGNTKDLILEYPSGDVTLDRAAWGGITGASPYPPLPKEFKGPFLELRFGFFYNLDPGQTR